MIQKKVEWLRWSRVDMISILCYDMKYSPQTMTHSRKEMGFPQFSLHGSKLRPSFRPFKCSIFVCFVGFLYEFFAYQNVWDQTSSKKVGYDIQYKCLLKRSSKLKNQYIGIRIFSSDLSHMIVFSMDSSSYTLCKIHSYNLNI